MKKEDEDRSLNAVEEAMRIKDRIISYGAQLELLNKDSTALSLEHKTLIRLIKALYKDFEHRIKVLDSFACVEFAEQILLAATAVSNVYHMHIH